jgi:hypothetical protein
MAKIVHARLDAESEKLLEQLARRLGWSESRIIREGIGQLAAGSLVSGAKRIIGLGKFSSGASDLGSNKARLRGFGR